MGKGRAAADSEARRRGGGGGLQILQDGLQRQREQADVLGQRLASASAPEAGPRIRHGTGFPSDVVLTLEPDEVAAAEAVVAEPAAVEVAPVRAARTASAVRRPTPGTSLTSSTVACLSL